MNGEPRILNLGAGNRPMEGVTNHDRTPHRPEIDIAHDLNDLPWPWEDDFFDQIIASSVFEHLEIDLVQTLDECWRILKPGGRLSAKVPFWQNDNAYADPTHRWRYSLRSFDVFDLKTNLGTELGFYTAHKWSIVKKPRLNKERSSVHITLRVEK